MYQFSTHSHPGSSLPSLWRQTEQLCRPGPKRSLRDPGLRQDGCVGIRSLHGSLLGRRRVSPVLPPRHEGLLQASHQYVFPHIAHEFWRTIERPRRAQVASHEWGSAVLANPGGGSSSPVPSHGGEVSLVHHLDHLDFHWLVSWFFHFQYPDPLEPSHHHPWADSQWPAPSAPVQNPSCRTAPSAPCLCSCSILGQS